MLLHKRMFYVKSVILYVQIVFAILIFAINLRLQSVNRTLLESNVTYNIIYIGFLFVDEAHNKYLAICFLLSGWISIFLQNLY